MSLSKDQKEQQFLKGMHVLQDIESEMNEMLKNYSEGQLSLGLASFQNEDLHHLLKPKSFRVGCASLLVSNDKSNGSLSLCNPPKEQLKFIYTDCSSSTSEKKKQPKMFSMQEDFDEEYYKEEKEKIETETQTKGNDPLGMLGITFPSQSVLNAQSHMRKVLESAIKIANILNQAQQQK